MQTPSSLDEATLKRLLEQQTNFKQRYDEIQRNKFQILYQTTPQETLAAYATRMRSHCGPGQEGYYPWLPTVDGVSVSLGGYQACLPTQQEKDAYRIVYGREIDVPTRPNKPTIALLKTDVN